MAGGIILTNNKSSITRTYNNGSAQTITATRLNAVYTPTTTDHGGPAGYLMTMEIVDQPGREFLPATPIAQLVINGVGGQALTDIKRWFSDAQAQGGQVDLSRLTISNTVNVDTIQSSFTIEKEREFHSFYVESAAGPVTLRIGTTPGGDEVMEDTEFSMPGSSKTIDKILNLSSNTEVFISGNDEALPLVFRFIQL